MLNKTTNHKTSIIFHEYLEISEQHQNEVVPFVTRMAYVSIESVQNEVAIKFFSFFFERLRDKCKAEKDIFKKNLYLIFDLWLTFCLLICYNFRKIIETWLSDPKMEFLVKSD